MTNLFYPEWLPIEEHDGQLCQYYIDEDGKEWVKPQTTPSDPMPEGFKKLMRIAKAVIIAENGHMHGTTEYICDCTDEGRCLGCRVLEVAQELTTEERKQIGEFEG